jgi:hypothetical protein
MAGFGRNGSRSSAERITQAERHREWIDLRRQGLLEAQIATRFGVSQQAVSKAILKYVHELPAREAVELRNEQLIRLDQLGEMAIELYETATNDLVRLQALNGLLKVEERRAKLLGLDALNTKGAKIKSRHHPRALDCGNTDAVRLEMLRDLQQLDDGELARSDN